MPRRIKLPALSRGPALALALAAGLPACAPQVPLPPEDRPVVAIDAGGVRNVTFPSGCVIRIGQSGKRLSQADNCTAAELRAAPRIRSNPVPPGKDAS